MEKGEEKVETGASAVLESRIDDRSEQRRHRSSMAIEDFETFWSRSQVTKLWEMKESDSLQVMVPEHRTGDRSGDGVKRSRWANPFRRPAPAMVQAYSTMIQSASDPYPMDDLTRATGPWTTHTCLAQYHWVWYITFSLWACHVNC
ncbi:hypothetical protein V6N13_076201 [Hibiscus sabdariffa]